MTAAKTWQRLKGENQLPKVVAGVTFRNGVEVPTRQSRPPPDPGVTQIPHSSKQDGLADLEAAPGISR